MRKFTELVIESDEKNLIQLLEHLKTANSKQFIFEKKLSEEYAQNIFVNDNQVACFRTTQKKHFDSKIWIVANNAQFRITNIVSNTISELGITRYNQVMYDFFHDFVSKFLDKRYNVYYSGEIVDMSELISKSAYDALIKWESVCNKSNPIGHPSDEKLWFEFIKQIVKNNDKLASSDLEKWLVEDKNWSFSFLNEEISKLIAYYEYSIDLLIYYDNSK